MIRHSYRRFAIVAVAALSSAGAAQQAAPDSTLHLSLVQAVRLAATQNASVEGARARVDAARAIVTQRRADLLPNVGAALVERGSTTNSATFPIEFPTPAGGTPLFDRNGAILGPVNTFDARAHVSQPLFDPRARARIATARIGVDLASVNARGVADQVAVVTANAYLAILRADAVYAARLADSTLAAELLVIAQDQLRAGTGIALDVTRARSQLTGARSQLIVARNERERTRVDLTGILGMPPGSVEPTDALATLPSAPPIEEAAAREIAKTNRKDLQVLDLQARVARQEASAIRTERLPTIGVFASEGLSQRNGRSYLPTYDWGLQLSLPVFDGFRRQGRVAEQDALAHDFDIRSRDLRYVIEGDVRNAMLNVRSASEVADAARERLALAEQEVSQARERFQAGVAGNADVITASLTLNGARTQLVDALMSYQGARIALARAQGSIAALE